jgi:cyclase
VLKTRIIPCLLLKNNGLVKSVKFKNHVYVGDPINAVKIFNDKEADELMFIDIDASRERRGPDFDLIYDISREAFMPFGYGGGIRNLDDIKRLLQSGVEKVAINSMALDDPDFVSRAAGICGSQSVVVVVDVKKDMLGHYRVYHHVKGKCLKGTPEEYTLRLQELGAGEILLQNVDRDGTYSGYDLGLIFRITSALNIPVIALGGASSVEDLARSVREGGASAAAAGSLFVFYGPHKAVLINYPDKKKLKQLLG